MISLNPSKYYPTIYYQSANAVNLETPLLKQDQRYMKRLNIYNEKYIK